ncbi:MAG: hypothetical protein HKP37_04755 [Boseongicola sp.]|nr:hypothetical protein [Boseongicola sp.]
MPLAAKTAVLKDATIIQVGSPMELYHNPANLFGTGVLAAPLMNFIDVKVPGLAGDYATASNPALHQT